MTDKKKIDDAKLENVAGGAAGANTVAGTEWADQSGLDGDTNLADLDVNREPSASTGTLGVDRTTKR